MRTLRALGLVCVVLLVAACGSAVGRNDTADSLPLGPMRVWGDDPATEGPPQRGGTLVLGTTAEHSSFDPATRNGNSVATAIYDTLMKMTPGGGVAPAMAEGMDTPDGGRTWLLHLRPGVRFHDGTDLDANAVIRNVQRHLDKPASPAHNTAKLVGSMRAPDPLTVEFTLTEPVAEFPVLFALPFTDGTLGMIISPAALDEYGDDIGKHPVGAGPFKFVEWIPDARTVVTRNEDYWQPDLPYLDGMEFRPLSDTESRYASIQNGDVDVIFAGYNQELVRGLANPDLKIYYGPGDGGEYLRFNFAKPPFDDRRMREAIIRAIDFNALAASQYSGRIVTAKSLFGDDSPYHTQAASDAWPTYDPARAKQLIDDYRASGGNPNFTFSTSMTRVAFTEFLQAQMAAVGITMDTKFYDLAEFTTAVTQSGNFQLTTWVGEVNTAFPGVGQLLSTNGPANAGKYSNPEVDRLLAQARVSTDGNERIRAYQQVELLSGQDLALAWFSRTYRSTITGTYVHGFNRYPTSTLWYDKVWMDPR